MKITNNLQMPETYMRIIRKRMDRKRNPDHFGITELADSPRIRYLKNKHWDEIVVDASDLFWAFLGQIIHGILEGANVDGAETESYLKYEFEGKIIVGVMDYYHPDDGGQIHDYKVMTTEGIIFKNEQSRLSYERQLNPYRWLLKMDKGLDARTLVVHAILRNWVKSKARVMGDYPKNPWVKIPVRVWTFEETEKYISERLSVHSVHGLPPVCLPEERWQRPTTWAVYSGQNKKATRVLETEEAAVLFAEEKKIKNWRIEKRDGIDNRCVGYCDVNKFCDYWIKTYSEKQVEDEIIEE